jgi:RNA polymerase sigma-70 factor (ECF subfamily)
VPYGRSEQLARAAVASREALASLYMAHAPQLYRYFWAHTGSASLAEDLVSETFLSAIRTLHTYRAERGSFNAWLFGIARRKLARYVSEVNGPLQVADLPTDALPDDAALHLDERIDLWQAVSELEGCDREVLALKFGAGLTYPEIAQVTGLRPGHVGVLLYRALQRLRARLAGGEGGHA